VAASESAVIAAGTRFQTGSRATLTDADHHVTLSILEVLGFNPGTAKPGELALMAEVREAVLANTMLARLAGDVDRLTADKTLIVRVRQDSENGKLPQIPHRRVARTIAQGSFVTTSAMVHEPTNREELVKVLRLSQLPHAFVDAYLEEYRKLSGLEQRNVVTIYEVGQTEDVGYVAFELLKGGGLIPAMNNKLPVGLALNCLAQMCLALDAVHGIGIVHGALRPEHFLFREDGVLVLADFNVVKHVCDTMGLAYPADLQHRWQVRTSGTLPGPRADFRALGGILHKMLFGESALSGSEPEGRLFEATRLPLPLSPLQACLDALLGVGSAEPVERAEDVLVELLALKESFPFDIRQTDNDSLPRTREVGRH